MKSIRKATSVLIALAFIFPVSLIFIPASNVSATEPDNTWIADTASNSSIGASWENSTLVAGQNIWFTSSHLGSCIWDSAISLTNFTVLVGVPSTTYINFTVDVTVTGDATILGSRIRGDTTHTLTIAGDANFSTGMCANIDLKLKLTGTSKTFSPTNAMWMYEVWATKTITQSGGSLILKRFIVDPAVIYWVDQGSHLYPFFSDANGLFQNHGIIAGDGIFQIAANYLASLSTYNLSIGAVSMALELYASGSVPGNRTIIMNDSWVMTGDLTIRSGHASKMLTLDTDDNALTCYHLKVSSLSKFNAGSSTITTTGVYSVRSGWINGQSAQFYDSGSWDTSNATATFDPGTSTITMSGTHEYAIFQNGSMPNNFNVLAGATIQCPKGITITGTANIDGSLSMSGPLSATPSILSDPTHVKLAASHRGDTAVSRPENTMAAFNYAISLGITIFETDVQRTNDGVFIAIHDSTWGRTTNGTGTIANTNWVGYGEYLDAGSYFSPAYSSEHVPLFSDVLTLAVTHNIVLWLDLYYGQAFDAGFYALLNSTGSQNNVVVQRSTTAGLAMFSALAESYILWGATTYADFQTAVAACVANDIEFITPVTALMLNAPYGYAYAHASGIGVAMAIDTTLTDPSTYQEYLTDGANFVISDSAIIANDVRTHFSEDPNAAISINIIPESIRPLIGLIFTMFAIGIIVGVIVEGTNSLRKQKMRTTEQMVKSVLNMVIYIIIGMASVGIMYSIIS